MSARRALEQIDSLSFDESNAYRPARRALEIDPIETCAMSDSGSPTSILPRFSTRLALLDRRKKVKSRTLATASALLLASGAIFAIPNALGIQDGQSAYVGVADATASPEQAVEISQVVTEADAHRKEQALKEADERLRDRQSSLAQEWENLRQEEMTQREQASGDHPVVSAECALGDGSQLGITPQAQVVYRQVCAKFPSITTYGGWRASNDDHGQGRAIDIMISSDPGWEVANWLVANAEALNVEYVIYQQSIWGSWAPGAGFTPMEDRGSITANHYDHVHVTVRA